MQFGLSDDTISLLNEVFEKYTKINEVILYGSRAKGNYREGSDIDLSIKGKELNFATQQNISNDIDNLLLPYLVDVSIYSSITNEALKEHIDNIGKTIYRRRSSV